MIGKDQGNFTYHQETNKNDVLLIDIINEKQLVITNTCFQKNPANSKSSIIAA